MGISFQNVDHSYKGAKKKEIIKALEGINLDISEKGEFIAVVGKTGSGKSTLLKHMNGLHIPTSGNIQIFDYTITKKKNKNPKMKKIRKRVGYVFQFPEYQLFEETVLKDIMFAPKNFGFSEEEARKKALSIMKLLGIEHLANKSPFNISGGQMRRVAIAGVLSYDPDIILLDEPTRGLDPKGALDIMELFYKLHKETNKTIIMISHDMDIVYKYANRIIVLNDAKQVYDGDKVKLFETDIYKDNHLTKPDVINLIDYLNNKLNLNIDYDHYDLDSLLEYLKEVL